MNYFEFYDLPQSFKIDESQLKKKFYALSKQYHPDFYVNEPQEKQDEILELSTVNNRAYRILSDPLMRIEYILELHHLIAEGDKYTLPQEFLMEMMDVNEALMDMEFEPDPSRLMVIGAQVDEIEASIFDQLKELTDQFDDHDTEKSEDILLKIKDLWYRQKYLMRVRNSMNKFKV